MHSYSFQKIFHKFIDSIALELKQSVKKKLFALNSKIDDDCDGKNRNLKHTAAECRSEIQCKRSKILLFLKSHWSFRHISQCTAVLSENENILAKIYLHSWVS